ncbi:hypothetical protein LINPERPRIM_LOCUS10159 [Linum perenne]
MVSTVVRSAIAISNQRCCDEVEAAFGPFVSFAAAQN